MIIARHSRVVGLLLFVFSAVSASHSQNFVASDVMTSVSLEDPKYGEIAVAKIGSRTITAREFLMNYAFGPAFPKREKDSKRRYLNFMIYEKLLALEGYARKLDATEIAQQTLSEIENDLATEELYKDDVLSKVEISEKEIQKGMKKDRVHLKIRWLFSTTKDQCLALDKLLENGVPFDSLYVFQFRDSLKEDERSMETTPFRSELKNPELAQVVDTLTTGKYSIPVHAPDGYYILNVTERWTNPLMNETEETKLHSDIQRALIQSRSDSLSDNYVQHLLINEHPTIIREPFDIVHTYLAKKALPEVKFSQWKLEKRLLERWGPVDISDLKPFEGQTLVRLTKHHFTVKDFMRWYNSRENNLHFEDSRPETFYSSLEQMVWQMARDRLLAEKALGRGMQRRESVRRQYAWWRDKVVYKLERRRISDSIPISDALIEKYFTTNQKKYRNENGELSPFEKIKDDVAKDYYSDALTERLLHNILRLKGKYKVEIKEEKLKGLDVEQENDPKAIDVYVVKKGGTFPRQAFPSIDYEWQTWN